MTRILNYIKKVQLSKEEIKNKTKSHNHVVEFINSIFYNAFDFTKKYFLFKIL